jgi:hypothetical protein
MLILTACSISSVPSSAPVAQINALRGQIPPLSAFAVTYYGCPVFAAGNYYNSDVSNAPVDPNSGAYIASVVQAGDTSGFYASTGVERANNANDATRLLRVRQDVKYHKFLMPYPWVSNFYIEPLSDRHAMVVQVQSCHLYEAGGTEYRDGVLSAFSGANWNLRASFVPLPPGNPSAMASGLSLFAGMVRWEDYQSGAIAHALNWSGVAHTVSQRQFVRPASATDDLLFYGSGSRQLPYGAHLRLKASFSVKGWGPQATAVANAMKTYGIYLADTGHGNGLYFANTVDGADPWDYGDLSSLRRVKMTDFEVLKLGQIMEVHH